MTEPRGSLTDRHQDTTIGEAFEKIGHQKCKKEMKLSLDEKVERLDSQNEKLWKSINLLTENIYKLNNNIERINNKNEISRIQQIACSHAPNTHKSMKTANSKYWARKNRGINEFHNLVFEEEYVEGKSKQHATSSIVEEGRNQSFSGKSKCINR